VYIYTHMANFFEKVKADAQGVEESLLGPDYKYYEFINTPSDMGMSSKGSISTIEHNIAGLIAYVSLLSSGKGEASKTGGPLGNKFFLKTGAKCKDTTSGETVQRSLYVNNVPDGSIPFISQGLGNVNFTEFRGLIPGTLSNLSQINPMQIFGAFMSGTNPDCQAITMETIDVNGIVSSDTQHIITNDIKAMNACWFGDKKNPVTGTTCKEAFTTLSDSQEFNQYLNKYNEKYLKGKKNSNFDDTAYDFKEYGLANNGKMDYNFDKFSDKQQDNKTQYDFSTMPKDPMIKVYYTSLSIMLLYIFYRVFQERK
jgi:hypothetical protein